MTSAPARRDLGFEVKPLDVQDSAGLRESLRGVDAVMSCLPYHLNIAWPRPRTTPGCTTST